MLFFWDRLETFGDNVALIAKDGKRISYIGLVDRSNKIASEIRKKSGVSQDELSSLLVAIEIDNTVDIIAAYLSCLRMKLPVILFEPGACRKDSRIMEVYKPHVLLSSGSHGLKYQFFNQPALDRDPDLAIMLSTSGSTGNPKLVRLSSHNIDSNARSIAAYLELNSSERAMATLPFHYVYGLSVLHSHLFVGGSLILNDYSVVDDPFWSLFDEMNATSLALVPNQFTLLEKSNFHKRAPQSLRYITQAGGDLDVVTGKKYTKLSEEQGWRLYLMYGQTEASPRISYVPPGDLAENFDSIGIAIPDGELHLEDELGRKIASPGVEGELVYSGPNVMMGYAGSREDLSLGKEVHYLKTGDLAVLKENGFFKITGRLKRIIKVYGLRLNLDDIERFLLAEGYSVKCVNVGEQLVIFYLPSDRPEGILKGVAERYNLRPNVLAAFQLNEFPLTGTGKTDYQKIVHEAKLELSEPSEEKPFDIKALILSATRQKTCSEQKSFNDLGGDSLSYLQVVMEFEKQLGYTPKNWDNTPIKELMELVPEAKDKRQIGTDILLRLVALCGVMSVHYTDWLTHGGTFLLLILTGYSFARFQTSRVLDGYGIKVLKSLLLPLIPLYFLIIGAYHFMWKPVDVEWMLLMGNYLPEAKGFLIPFWFICAYAQLMVLLVLVLKVPLFQKKFLSSNWSFVLSLFSLCLSLFTVIWFVYDMENLREFITLNRSVLFCAVFALLGWLTYLADNQVRKLVVLGLSLIVAVFYGIDNLSKPVFIIAGVAALMWLPSVYMLKHVVGLLLKLGLASMYIYLLHGVFVYLFIKVVPLKVMYGQTVGYIVLILFSFFAGVLVKEGMQRIGMFAGSKKVLGPMN